MMEVKRNEGRFWQKKLFPAICQSSINLTRLLSWVALSKRYLGHKGVILWSRVPLLMKSGALEMKRKGWISMVKIEGNDEDDEHRGKVKLKGTREK